MGPQRLFGLRGILTFMNRTALRLLPLSFVALVVLTFFVPELAVAQQLTAQCQGIDCELCHLFETANRLIQYAILAASVFAAGLFAYAGAKLIIAQGDPTKIAEVKNTFRSVIVGYVIALCAFLFVDTLINSIAQKKFTWKNVQCQTIKRKLDGGLTFQTPQAVSVVNTQYLVDGEGAIYSQPSPDGSGSREAKCADCVQVSSIVPGFNRSQSCGEQVNGACLVSPQISEQLTNFARDAQTAGISWEATELWPPTSSAHQAGCHYNGTCIDAAFRGTPATAQNIAQFISVANRNGFRAEFEVAKQEQADQIRMQAAQHGVTLGPRDVLVVPYINGAHFSMYKR